MACREDALRFLKRLWLEQTTPCPKCGAQLAYLHKKAKKSSNDWQCPSCGAVYRTISILQRLNEG